MSKVEVIHEWESTSNKWCLSKDFTGGCYRVVRDSEIGG